jgi:hypothetical protein
MYHVIRIFPNGIDVESSMALVCVDVEEILASEDLEIKLVLESRHGLDTSGVKWLSQCQHGMDGEE